jgi:toxin ParE1/3/4
MRLRFSIAARLQILEIHTHIAEHNPRAAAAVVQRIRAAADLLQAFPRLGREGRDAGTREWVVRGLPYIIVYEIDATDDGEVTILAIFHGARDR